MAMNTNQGLSARSGRGARTRLLAVVAAILLCPSFAVSAPATTAAGRAMPFSPGERLTFQVRWSFVHAGDAVLEVLPFERMGGVEVRRFAMTATTTPLADIFYKVRDRIDSYVDRGMTRSRLYHKKKAGSRKRDVVVRFDWDAGRAAYEAFGTRTHAVDLAPGAHDPLSVFYYFRLHDLRVGGVIEAPVCDGKKCVQGRARVVKRETITIAGGTYDTFLVEPDLAHIGGVFEKSRDAKLEIWVTADSRRLPVKIRSKVVVGHFVAELVSAAK